MTAPDDYASGGILHGHGMTFALIAFFVGMPLVVAFATSDGQIFGLNFSPAPGGSLPVSDGSAGGAAVISRDAFEDGETTPSQPDPARQSGTTLSEEERELLAIVH